MSNEDPVNRHLAEIAEAKWLLQNPQFAERPATVREFIGPDYLNIEDTVRPGVLDALVEIFGNHIDREWISLKRRAIMTGGIGIGKTTFASIALPYMVHWVFCLKDPQEYFGLMSGSRIAFMMMSTSEKQAREVLFGDVKARIDNSPWFQSRCRRDPKFENQIRFDKEIWILPGGSEETAFEGYNILGGILDEGDSHKKTARKDYAEQGYDTINSRVESRFMNHAIGKHRGLIIIIGQTKSATGFMSKMYKEFEEDKDAAAVRMTIWQSHGWHKYTENPDDALNNRETAPRKSFIYDVLRKEITPKSEAVAEGIWTGKDTKTYIEVPLAYINPFIKNPQKALRDLAGIPPESGDPFIALTHYIHKGSDLWTERMGVGAPVNDSPNAPQFAEWFQATDRLKRVMHLDLAYSAEGDALGMAMGHVPELVTTAEDEDQPLIIFDLLLRIKAAPGTEIIFSDVRRLIYELKYKRKFNLTHITMDGFQCLAGDTRVPLLDGRTLTMEELSEQYPNGGVEVYAYNHATGRITNGKVTKAHWTGMREIVNVTLDNGETVKCSDDHKFMLRTGEYREAKDLRRGDSLMPLYRRITRPPYMDGYEQVLQPSAERNTNERWIRDTGSEWRPGKWEYTHRMVAGKIQANEVIHHENGKLDNDSRNLKVIKRADHAAHHEMSASHRQAISSAISKSNRERTGKDSRRYRHDVTIEKLEQLAHLSRRAVTEKTGWSQDVIYARLKEHGYSGWSEFRSKVNHKVTSVEFTGESEDVFDISVDEYHNFAIGSGVFVHNSTDFQQQLRKKRFHVEYLSVDKKKMPYEDLREAIYDERCLYPPYMTKLDKGDTELVNIAQRELSQLEDVGNKIDHPKDGSKDVTDAMAGVVHYLMQDSQFRRGARRSRGGTEWKEMTEGELRRILSVPSDSSTTPVSLEQFKSDAAQRPVNIEQQTALSWDMFQTQWQPNQQRIL